MDRFDPFVKYSDIYGDVINWEKDPMNKPQNQNKYFFSDGKTYYEQICKMLKLMSVFKDAFNQIYDNEDEISSAWQNFIDNLSATAIAGEEAGVELTWTDTSVNFAFTIPIAVDVAGISSITFNSDYTMTITLTDGRTYTSTSLRGPQGEQGIQGPPGEQGIQGPQGNPGQGVPTSGTTGQALVKSSNNDYDTEWKTLMGVPSTYTANNLAKINSNGQIEDSGKSLANLQELPKLLWTNANVSSPFSAQTISLDLSGYNGVWIVFASSNSSNNQYNSILLFDNLRYRIEFVEPTSATYGLIVVSSRIVTKTNNGLKFDVGSQATTLGFADTDNTRIIPYKIYGV